MNKGINKLMIIAVVLVLIVTIVAGYFIWATNEANIALDTVRNNLNSTLNNLYVVEDQLFSTQENLKKEIDKSSSLEIALNNTSEELERVNSELDVANITIANLKNEEYELVYIGDFKLTHYCSERYEHICGTGSGITATGTTVTPGRSVAVDPNVIPYGTKIYIEGYGWRFAEDCGSAVNNKQIDIAVDTHDNAISMGTQSGGVWILVKN